MEIEEGEIHKFMTGNDCYALRCAFLHEGSNNINEQGAAEQVGEKFIIMCSDVIQIHKCASDKLTFFLTNFCIDIINGIEDWLKEVSIDKDKARQNKVNTLMKIYLPDQVDNNGNVLGAIINNLEKET